jgi:alpha-tubulin suppressor-like RCC1 family protein
VKLKLPLAAPVEKSNTQVAVGSKHTLILTDGDVFSTGSPDDGRLGHTDLHGYFAYRLF